MSLAGGGMFWSKEMVSWCWFAAYMACSKNVQAIQNPARLSDSSLKLGIKNFRSFRYRYRWLHVLEKMEWNSMRWFFPYRTSWRCKHQHQEVVSFLRTCSRRLPISKVYTVLDSRLQTGVRKPRRILDGLNVLRARHAKRLVAISWRNLDCNRLLLIIFPF